MNSHNFRIIDRRNLESVRSQVTVARHLDTGALLVHLDPPGERENFFSITFRTPPEDDSGTPHILEHTVLSGSRKFPVKDPFMELVRSSMATFINALTYGDRTVYPVGSADRADFLNLVQVYMDAVFNPLLREESFWQEGFRLQVNDDGSLTPSGVVYNEMKGAYSDRDSYMEREVARVLYPDSPYGRDSGGDPSAITRLTFQRYMSFYERHYHPGNSCLFALTGIPFDEFACRLQELLPLDRIGFEQVLIKDQPRFNAPVTATIPCPGENHERTVLSAWMVNGSGDPVEDLAFSLLEDVLLDDDSSPVKKALLDSGLGTGLATCGYDADSRQRSFIVGLKGVRPGDEEAVLELIGSCLGSFVAEGPEEGLVEGMLHRKELVLRYAGSGWPFAVMSHVSAAWTHGMEIMKALDLNSILNELRSRLSSKPRYMERMTEKWLIENTHRADLVFEPETGLASRLEEGILRELDELRGRLTKDQLRELRENGERAETALATPDSPAALATIPRLDPRKLQPMPPAIFHKTLRLEEGTILATDMAASGLGYVDICLDVSGLDGELLPFLPLFAAVITRTGADGIPHLTMAQRELRSSSGLSCSVNAVTSTIHSIHRWRSVLKLSGYCLEKDLAEMLQLMELRLFRSELGDGDLILKVLRENAEQVRSSIIPRGDSFASLRARSGISPGHLVSELMSGISFANRILAVDGKTLESTIVAFRGIAEYLRESADRTISWTGPERCLDLIRSWLEKHSAGGHATRMEAGDLPKASLEGIQVDAETSFAAAAIPGLPLEHRLAVPGIVAVRMLSEGYLWNELRARNGAYGAGASFSGGTMTLSSYRDPDPLESTRCFSNAVKDLSRHLDLDRRSIDDSITATLKGMNPPLRPAGANGIALLRHFKGISPKTAEQVLKRLTAVDEARIQEFSDWLSSSSGPMRTCIVGSPGVLREAGVKEITEIQGGI